MSYSQYDEEYYILKALGSQTGVFLDIGAYDGVTFSNTRALSDLGWSGVLVEPSPWLFEALLKAYENNSKVELVQGLVGWAGGGTRIQKFWPSPDAVSTTEADIYDKWKTYAAYQRTCWVPQVTVPELHRFFPQLKDAKFVNIDTEGTSADIFMHYPFDLNKPEVFCVEYDDKLAEVTEWARTFGYETLHLNGTNIVLGR